jgi:adenylate kinase family enzyme
MTLRRRKRVCSTCGALADDGLFCRMCGSRLDDAATLSDAAHEWSPRRLQLAGLLDRARFAAGYLQTRSRARRQLGVIDAELRRLSGERQQGMIAPGEATFRGDKKAAAQARDRIRAVDERIQHEHEKQRRVVEEATSRIEHEQRSVASTQIVEEPESAPEEKP